MVQLLLDAGYDWITPWCTLLLWGFEAPGRNRWWQPRGRQEARIALQVIMHSLIVAGFRFLGGDGQRFDRTLECSVRVLSTRRSARGAGLDDCWMKKGLVLVRDKNRRVLFTIMKAGD